MLYEFNVEGILQYHKLHLKPPSFGGPKPTWPPFGYYYVTTS